MKMNMDERPQQGSMSITIESLTRVSNQLLQCLQQNTNLRMKYADDPEKFYQSQQQINSLLQELSQLSQQHLPLIIQSHLSQPLITLLSHPNVDLAIDVVNLLYQLLQEQPQEDKLFQVYFRWIVWLVENSTAQALVGIVARIDEENNLNQYQAGLKCLKLLQIMMNSTDQVYTLLGQDKQLFSYLSNRILPNFIIKHKTIDDNKYVSSDLLVQLLSNSERSQHLFSQFSGVEVLLETISSYETKLPENQDEKEFLNNLFTSLAILLINYMLRQNNRVYCEMKGNYLMISFLKMKNQYSAQALKCMANSLIGVDTESQKTAVHAMINDGALKYLFPVFRRKGLRGQDVDQQKAIDQSTLAIFYAMARSSTDVFKDRLQYKLIQNRFENLQRFFELRNQYAEALDSQEQNQHEQQNNKEKEKGNTSEYLQRLSQGLSLIETVDKTILVFIDKYSKLKPKIINLFNIYGVKYEQVEKTLKDHYQYIGMKDEKAYVETLLANNLLLLKKSLNRQQEGQQKKETEVKLN